MSISRITNPWKIPIIVAFLDKERPWPMLVVRPEMHSIRPGRMLILSENHEFTGTATISKYWRHGVIMRVTSDDNQLELLLYARYTQMILSFWMYLLMWFYIITRRCDKGHVNDLISGTYYFLISYHTLNTSTSLEHTFNPWEGSVRSFPREFFEYTDPRDGRIHIGRFNNGLRILGERDEIV